MKNQCTKENWTDIYNLVLFARSNGMEGLDDIKRKASINMHRGEYKTPAKAFEAMDTNKEPQYDPELKELVTQEVDKIKYLFEKDTNPIAGIANCISMACSTVSIVKEIKDMKRENEMLEKNNQIIDSNNIELKKVLSHVRKENEKLSERLQSMRSSAFEISKM